jgi:UDP-N-acetylmuramate dehydrogenase
LEIKADEFTEKRKRTQPPGASIGSMFKNPPGDYAGRLIEAAGLKGARIGNAEISRLHANFFVNTGGASARNVYSLINMARERVRAQFGIDLELEIELAGEW